MISKDPYLGWKEQVSGGIDCYDVPVKYRSRTEIMKEPFVKVLFAKLKTFLEPSKEK